MTRKFDVRWEAISAPVVQVVETENGTFNYMCQTPFRLDQAHATWANQLFGATAEQIIEAAESDLEKYPEELNKLLEKLQLAMVVAS